MGISVIHFNVRSIIKNKQKIEELLYDFNKSPHVIAISETKLNDDSNLGQTNIQGYHLLNENSKSNAGGVALYVSQKLNYVRKPELSFVLPDSKNLFDEISLDIKTKALILGVNYRHPQNNFTTFQEQYCKLLNQLSYEKRNYIICGDININILSPNYKPTILNYLNELYSVTCCNIINIPTRISDSSATLIDHMYTNMLQNEVHGGVLINDISDHLPIFCTVLVKPQHRLRSIKKLVRDFKKFGRSKFVRDIFDMVENFSFNDNDDIDEAMNNFISSFKQITDMHAPLRLNSRKERKPALKPWIAKGILKSIKTKNILFNQCYKRNN